MPELDFFDCNCMVGPRTAPRPETILTIEQMIEELEYAGIKQALIFHSYAKEYDAVIGNDKCSEVCAQYPNLHPCYAVLPHHTGEMPTGDALLQYLEKGGARAVKIFPYDHNLGLGETWCGELYATLAEAGVPLFLDWYDQLNWNDVDSILSHHPTLNLIMIRIFYRVDRWMYPLLKKYPTLRCEYELYDVHRGIEALTQRFGAERLLFGTGLPEWDPGAVVSSLQYAEISQEEKERIAHKNLESLLWKQTASRSEIVSSSIEVGGAR
jgi:predicted TIM-barrel fold metal-dependent hydrolase